MSLGYWIAVALFGIPLAIFIYAILPELLAPRHTPRDYCYGGITFPRILTSSTGSLITVTTLLNATVTSGYWGGSMPFVGWLVGALFLYPLLLYFLISADSVRKYFEQPASRARWLECASEDELIRWSDCGKEDKKNKNDEKKIAFIPNAERRDFIDTVVGFISDNYSPKIRPAYYILFILITFFILFAEANFFILWINVLFDGIYTNPIFIGIFILVASFLYVVIGGYRQVLRTDEIQCIIIYSTCIFAIVALLDSYWPVDFGELTSQVLWTTASQEQIVSLPTSFNRFGDPISPTEADAYNAFYGFMLIGLLFVFTPDLWNRITRAMYVDEKFGRNNQSKIQKRNLIYFLLLLIVMLVSGSLIFVYVSTYALHTDIFRNLPVLDASDTVYRAYDLFYVLSQSEFDTKLPEWFPFRSYHDFILISILIVVMLAALTTFDTGLMTLAQMRAENTQYMAKIQPSNSRQETILERLGIKRAGRSSVAQLQINMLVLFLVVIIGTIIMHITLDNKDHNFVVVIIGGISLTVFITLAAFALVVRTFDPSWMRGEAWSVIIGYGVGLGIGILLWLGFRILPFDIPFFTAKNTETSLQLDKFVILQIVGYSFVYLYWQKTVKMWPRVVRLIARRR